jgi:predicted RNA binding protein YcfA (HicA-like mRNA interferase family)
MLKEGSHQSYQHPHDGRDQIPDGAIQLLRPESNGV